MEEIRRTDGHILRRNTRLSLDFHSLYNPTTAAPEENTFELRKGTGAMIGQIAFREFDRNRAFADTPWGNMVISKSSFRAPYDVTLGGSPVASFTFNMLHTKVNIAFAKGERLKFDTKLITMGLSCDIGPGRIEVVWEGEYGPADVKQEGLVLRDMPKDVSDRIDDARADYKRRKKAKLLTAGEPKSIQTPYYVQWRVHLPREFDGRNDMLSTLAFITSFRCLLAEIPQA